MPVIRALYVYPVKSCGGIALDDALLEAQGLQWDRRWMVVNESGRFVSQREYASMALIHTAFVEDGIRLTMDGMAASLTLPFETPAGLARVPSSVWKDSFEALDEGDAAAQWFSAALGVAVRLVRFAADVTRLASPQWTGGVEVPTSFADGFPLLVTSEASLAELNVRLEAKGATAVPMNRFRPNIVVDGEGAFDEDFIETMSIGDGGIVLRFVKPCTRCPITTIDQHTGAPDPQWPHEPLDTMAGWRADPRVDDGLVFGQNAIVELGLGRRVNVGAEAQWEFRFDE